MVKFFLFFFLTAGWIARFSFFFACPCFLGVIGLKMKLKLYNLELQSFIRLSSIFKKETIIMKSYNVTILSKIAWNAPDWHIWEHFKHFIKVEKILKGSLNLIPSTLPSVKIQIMGGKVFLRCKGKTLLGIVNKRLKAKNLLTSPSNALLPQLNFPANNLNFHWRWWDRIQSFILYQNR